MKKTKYQWNSLELKQRAKRCELAVLVVGLVGVIGLFAGQIMILVGAILIMGAVYIYMADLRKKDKATRRFDNETR